MNDPVFTGGGFGPGRLDRMSASLQARVAAADVQYERDAAREQRDAEQVAAMRQEDAIAASITEAQRRGEMVDVRQAIRQGGVGRTRGEVAAFASAQGDLEDARSAAAERAAFQKWQAERTADTSADTTAATPDEIATAELSASRAEAHLAERRARGKLLAQARVLAALDAGRR